MNDINKCFYKYTEELERYIISKEGKSISTNIALQHLKMIKALYEALHKDYAELLSEHLNKK